MEALDLKQFIWLSKQNNKSYIILAITEFKGDDVVVYRPTQDSGSILVSSVSDFCREFEAIYELNA